MSIYLVEIDGYNPATAAVETLRYATRAYTSRPTDTPANARYLPRLATALNLEQSMYSQGTTGGASEVGVGAVELANTDGALDGLLDFGFAGRAVRVYSIAGAKSSLASRVLVFRGTVEQPEFSLERVTFRVRDRLAELDKPVCTARLRGDNDPTLTPIGIEGDDDSDGQLRPVTLGWCYNMTAVCVCPQKLVYQVHDGPVKNIPFVYDSGVELYANLALNGGFDTDDDTWFHYNAAIEDGVCKIGTYAQVNQRIKTLVPGLLYEVSFDITGSADTPSGYGMKVSIGDTEWNVPEAPGYNARISFTFTVGIEPPDDNTYLWFETWGGTIDISIDNVAVKPVPLDYPNLTELEAVTIHPGSYAKCASEGLIRLGASPAGEVTADVQGTSAGPNLVSNGHFDNTSAWTLAGGWSLDTTNNRAVKSAGATTDYLSQVIPVTPGATYQVRIIVRDYAGGYVQAAVGNTWGETLSANGVYMATVVAADSNGLQIRGGPLFGGSITAIDVRRKFILSGGNDGWRKPANLLRVLALGYGGVADEDLDEDSFAAILALNLPLIGHSYAADADTVIQAMDEVCRDAGLWWTFTLDGRLRIGRLVLPSGEPAAEFKLRSESLESGGIERLATGDEGSGVPVWKVNVAYQRNWTVQTSSLSTDQVFAQSSVAGVVSDERRAWLNAEYRTASAEDATVQTKYPRAPEMTVETGIYVRNHAQAEAARLLALFGSRRDQIGRAHV